MAEQVSDAEIAERIERYRPNAGDGSSRDLAFQTYSEVAELRAEMEKRTRTLETILPYARALSGELETGGEPSLYLKQLYEDISAAQAILDND